MFEFRTIAAHALTVLVGPNDSGKSTILQALMALLQRRQGPGLLLGGVEGINLQDSRTWSSCRWTARPNSASTQR